MTAQCLPTESLYNRRWVIVIIIFTVLLLVTLYTSDTLTVVQGRIKSDENEQTRGKSQLHGGVYPLRDASRTNDTVSATGSILPVIMCMIFTTPDEYDHKGLAVRLTWAKRCDYYAFFYSKSAKNITGGIALDVPEGREYLTAKSMKAFQLSYEAYKDKVNWYLKADDDTYFIMENLRSLLSNLNPSKPHYLGHRSIDFLKMGYNSGGAGYVFSRSTAKLLVEKGDAFPDSCPINGGIEDLDIGRCLEAFRVYPEETRDNLQRITFHPDHPLKLLLGEGDATSVYQYTVQNYTFGNPNGIKVMSPYTISFHYMRPGHMYMYDFLLYDLKRY